MKITILHVPWQVVVKILRLIKRLAVLIPGIAVTYIAVDRLFPVLDEILPKGVVILVLYALVAYILIPFATRLLHLVVRR